MPAASATLAIATAPDWSDNGSKFSKTMMDFRWDLFGATLDPTTYQPVFAVPIKLQNDTNNAGVPLTIDQDTNNIAVDIDAENTTTDVFNVSATVLTTGWLFDASDMNALTTGGGFRLTDGSANTGVRNIMLLTLSSTAATGCVPLHITSSGTSEALRITLNATAVPIVFSGAGTFTQTGVGASGAATAVPSNPDGYLRIKVAATTYVVPYFANA